ncbi:MAG: tRNA uridine-5-carboxymethylaminomethyl(34) synthesis GTPase MnmE [Treponema sp.]|nr:tRNA uridine-5-carboxymethylaminomethyl(34) synthesis GTPase MnmE [Treponema sp.]
MNNSQYTPEEPISSIATALAPAALGIVRVSGKNSIELVSKVFSSPKRLMEAAGNTIVYGWIKDGDAPVDEVMVAVYRAPKSFTGEDMCEIFCHGGPAVVTAVQNLMLKSGFRQAERGEYTFRAYINGKTDLTKAEAVKEIIDSHTDASRGRAAGRLAGSLYEEIDSIKKLVIDTLAAIEVEIEYPEDEETIADAFDSSDIKKARDRLKELVDSWKGEKLYQDGARVVLCGRTNAGKSSLFNSILKEERAIVSDIEGTTRDFLESWASFDGIPVRLFDTAGLRETEDVIEAQGVEITRNLSTDADVVLYLVASNTGLDEADVQFLENCKEPVLVIWTKADVAEGSAVTALADSVRAKIPQFRGEISISSKKGSGMDAMYQAVKSILTSGLSTERTQAGLGSERQKEAVAEALECIEHALISAADNYTLDAVVQDLEDTLEALGVVTGDVTPDDVLGSIFANFCVGK